MVDYKPIEEDENENDDDLTKEGTGFEGGHYDRVNANKDKKEMV